MPSDNPIRRSLAVPWAIRRSEMKTAMYLMHDSDAEHGPEPVEAEAAGQIAVLPFHGVVLQHPGVYGEWGTGFVYTTWWGEVFDSLMADPDISAVVASFHSPGGIVYGVEELSDKIFAARGIKPAVAVVNSQAASAALWIATAFERVVVTPSGEMGSHGVWTMHEDISGMLDEMGVAVTLIHAGEHKVEGNPFEPLDDEARAELQRSVDESFAAFTRGLARNRGVSEDTVLSDFGQGRMFSAVRAVEVGMADDVMTLDEVVAELSASSDEGGELSEAEGRAAPGVETRNMPAADGEICADTDNESAIVSIDGVALRYGSLSRDMGDWREVFEPGAFTESIANDDLRVIWQHDPKCVFGRVKKGTARIWEDDGVRYSANPPDAQWARDAVESIRRGDVDQNSFKFAVLPGGVRWERRGGVDTRVISRARLFEVGPQTHPAYEDTTVAVSGLAAWRLSEAYAEARAAEAKAERELYERRRKLMQMSL